MFCSSCGASIPDNAGFCSVCGSKTGSASEVTPAVQCADEDALETYTFSSKRFATFSNFIYSGRTITTVDIYSNSLELDILPKKLNKIPVIKYDEIASAIITKHFAVTSIFMLVLLVAVLFSAASAGAGDSAFLLLLIIPLEIISGINSKLTINFKNGNSIKLLSAHRDSVQTIKDEIDERI